MLWSSEQLEQWHLTQKEYVEDVAVVSSQEVERHRSSARQEMVQLLNTFLARTITLREFNTVFQQKTHSEWSIFHLRGMSGGLFLNRLVKYVPSEENFSHLLRLMIRVPEDVRSGRQQMQAFVLFLEGLIASQQAQRGQLQPARVPFFLSVWWHIQDPERWPIFYLEVRQVLAPEGKQQGDSQDPVKRYFEFCDRFTSLAKELGISSWELENVCRWSGQRSKEERSSRTTQLPCERIPSHRRDSVMTDQKEAMRLNISSAHHEDKGRREENRSFNTSHTHIQWILAKIGLKVGCRVWIASEDHGKVWNGERLGDLSLSSLPLLTNPQLQKVIRQIDVLWLLDNDVIAAYEIEQTRTDISTKLLRLYDLGTLFPKNEMHLCVVVPQERLKNVQFEMSRPMFHKNEVQKHCTIVFKEVLLQQQEHILRWASDPSVIRDFTLHMSEYR